MDPNQYSYNAIHELGYSHGYAMGRNAKQLIINDKLMVELLAQSTTAIMAYKSGYDNGFRAGLLDGNRS